MCFKHTTNEADYCTGCDFFCKPDAKTKIKIQFKGILPTLQTLYYATINCQIQKTYTNSSGKNITIQPTKTYEEAVKIAKTCTQNCVHYQK